MRNSETVEKSEAQSWNALKWKPVFITQVSMWGHQQFTKVSASDSDTIKKKNRAAKDITICKY